jgi:hypothetical protein
LGVLSKRRGALCSFKKSFKRAGQLMKIGGKINQLDGSPSRDFRSFLSLPALEIGTQDEEFPPDLDDPNLFFLNDSAEMPYREASQTGGVGNIKKHSFCGT